MQQNIIFKNIDGKINILVKDTLTYEIFIKSLKNRLEKLYIKDNLLKSTVTINISNISLDTRQILNLFDVLSEYGNIFVGKIIYKEKCEKNIVLHEGNIRSGEIKIFTNNTLLIGNINKGAKVIVNGNLYVIGKVNGMVELKNINDKLMASSIYNAYIKICSIEKLMDGNMENGVIKIDKNMLLEEKFTDRREFLYV